jgi:hypothetical protein
MARGGRREGAGRKPGSLNKATADIREAAQEYTGEALQVLAEVMRSTEHPAAARVSAASAILDRGHGRPKQSVDVDANVRAAIQKIELVGVRPSGG